MRKSLWGVTIFMLQRKPVQQLLHIQPEEIFLPDPQLMIQVWSLPQHHSSAYTHQEFGLKYHENFFSFYIWDLFVLFIFTFKRVTFSRSSAEPCEIETEQPTAPCNPMTSWLWEERKIISGLVTLQTLLSPDLLTCLWLQKMILDYFPQWTRVFSVQFFILCSQTCYR